MFFILSSSQNLNIPFYLATSQIVCCYGDSSNDLTITLANLKATHSTNKQLINLHLNLRLLDKKHTCEADIDLLCSQISPADALTTTGLKSQRTN